ncbi:hypothetical protein ACFOW6_01505 [Fodinicurvata halophila]|uniref:Uncharacterized protein n=1 Tax=Fodinicurvata halophila TaxID=1419723 RepID=A0ABV8UGB1_9PROT
MSFKDFSSKQKPKPDNKPGTKPETAPSAGGKTGQSAKDAKPAR